jgi:pyridoxal phosphate enzyme (YggS family)
MTSSFSVDQIAERLVQIQQTIPASVKLIAVSKQVSVDAMRAAYEAGIRDFGESRIQEATEKQAQLHDLPDITWHFIGHLQTNKAARALEQFQWIHSLDSLKLAQKLNQLATERAESPNLCLQVKILPDPSKYGWTVPDLLSDLAALNDCASLKIVGLMTIPPYGLDSTDTLAVFRQTRELAEQIRQQNWSTIHMQQLSMGMSDDYQLAVKAGATMIRLGRTLFGDRPSTQP